MPVKEKGGCSVGKKADKGGCKEGKKKKLVVVKKGKMVEKKLYKATMVTEAPAKKKVVVAPKLPNFEIFFKSKGGNEKDRKQWKAIQRCELLE